jgi:hypothetical protein
VFLKAGLFPQIVSRDEVPRYIQALEDADRGDLSALTQFFVQGQLARFNQALNIAEDVNQPSKTIQLAIQSIKDTTSQRKRERNQSLLSVLQTADELVELGVNKIEETVDQLQEAGLSARVARSEKDTSHHYRTQIVGFAKKHGYFADTSKYRSWIRVVFETTPRTQFLLHFHSRGFEFLGVVVCAALLEVIDPSDVVDGPASREVIDIVTEPFEFYSTDTHEEAKNRFMSWLDETIALGLAQVQRFL